MDRQRLAKIAHSLCALCDFAHSPAISSKSENSGNRFKLWQLFFWHDSCSSSVRRGKLLFEEN
jgi:hypothetical protein